MKAIVCWLPPHPPTPPTKSSFVHLKSISNNVSMQPIMGCFFSSNKKPMPIHAEADDRLYWGLLQNQIIIITLAVHSAVE